MEQMAKIPAAVKSWRSPATEIFNDAKLFAATPSSGLKWRTIIKTLIDADKTAFTELLGINILSPVHDIRPESHTLIRQNSVRSVCEHLRQ